MAITYSMLARLVEGLAEAHAVTPHALRDMPEVLEEAGLAPEDIDEDVIAEANRYHRHVLHTWAIAHGATVA